LIDRPKGSIDGERRPNMTGAGKGHNAASRQATRSEGHFDGFNVAARSAVIEGHVDAATLPRVADMLPPEKSGADLAYRIAGTADAIGRPALEVSITGSVPLTCQRCLQAFVWPVNQRTLLLLARDERELARLDEEDHEHEVVLAAAPLDSVELVEDELLLTLPFAPRCPDEICPALKDRAGASREAPVKPSAFEALAALQPESGAKARRRNES
jgi:DUF177 domain-containing protein